MSLDPRTRVDRGLFNDDAPFNGAKLSPFDVNVIAMITASAPGYKLGLTLYEILSRISRYARAFGVTWKQNFIRFYLVKLTKLIFYLFINFYFNSKSQMLRIQYMYVAACIKNDTLAVRTCVNLRALIVITFEVELIQQSRETMGGSKGELRVAIAPQYHKLASQLAPTIKKLSE